MNELCAKKGIKREFSMARTPQQNGVAERRNRTLIEAARTMLADSLLPIPFWAEAVNTACYVLNRLLLYTPYAMAASIPTGATLLYYGAYDDEDVGAEANFNNMDNTIDVSFIPTVRVHKDHPKEEPKAISPALEDESWVEAMQEELLQFKLQKVWILVDLPFGKKAIGTKIEAIRLFLAFASFMGFHVYQMDVKSAFLYGTVEKEVYVHQPLGFVDPAHPNKVAYELPLN
ncbi:putative ribonuclease H-like domain-containing protein [Tanacetum coccineum]